MHFTQAPFLEPTSSVAESAVTLPMTITADERTQLVRICLRTTRDCNTAEGLAQETLLEALRHWHKLRDAHDPLARGRWLAAAASHICRRWVRRHGRELQRATHLDTSDAFETFDDLYNQTDKRT